MSWFSKLKESGKNIINRYPKLKSYARDIYDSLKKLRDVIVNIFWDIVRFFKNILLIIYLALLRGAEILLLNFFDFIKAIIRFIIDVIRWPLEHIIYPFIHWLADLTEMLLNAIEVNDFVAVVFFFLLIFSCFFLRLILKFT